MIEYKISNWQLIFIPLAISIFWSFLQPVLIIPFAILHVLLLLNIKSFYLNEVGINSKSIFGIKTISFSEIEFIDIYTPGFYYDNKRMGNGIFVSGKNKRIFIEGAFTKKNTEKSIALLRYLKENKFIVEVWKPKKSYPLKIFQEFTQTELIHNRIKGTARESIYKRHKKIDENNKFI